MAYYRENVSMLAKLLDVSNDPKLNEDDLTVASLLFADENGKTTEIAATPMNMGGRLFFQLLTKVTEPGVPIPINDLFTMNAAVYFAELWEDPERGKRTLLDAIRANKTVTIVLK